MTEIKIPPGGAIQWTSASSSGGDNQSFAVSYLLPVDERWWGVRFNSFVVLDAEELARAVGAKPGAEGGGSTPEGG
jgi:hypothetical protein